MKFLNQLRERRIEKIERRVGALSVVMETTEDEADYGRAEAERQRLWLDRSKLVKKLPPTYEGDHTP